MSANIQEAGNRIASSLQDQQGIDIDQLLSEWKSHTKEVIKTSHTAVQQELGQTVHNLITKLDAGHQQQFATHQSHLVKHDEEILRLQNLVKQVREEWQNEIANGVSVSRTGGLVLQMGP